MKGSIIKRGKKWSYIVWIEDSETGEKKQKWFSGFDKKKDAENALVDTLYKIEHGTYIRPEEITLAEYLRDWLKTYAEPNLAQTTVDGYRNNIEKHIIPNIGTIKLQRLRAKHIQELYSDLQNGHCSGEKKKLAAKTIIYVHRVLRQSLEHAYRKQLISRNIADDVKAPTAKKYRPEVYNEQLLKSLLYAIKDNPFEVPITIASTLGLRRGEVLGLKWDDINYKNSTIIIKRQLIPTSKGLDFQSPKTEDSIRTIPVPPSLMALLKKERLIQKKNQASFGQVYNQQNLICCRMDGSAIHPSLLSHAFSRILKQNNLPHIRFHDLRHSVATLMLTKGVPMKVASQILGHSTIGITMDLYSHVLDDMKTDATSKIESALFGS